MFHNYFYLKRLAHDLNQQLKGKELLECFSQNKDELILGFADEFKELYIKASLSSKIGLLYFTDEFKRARKNSINLFGQVLNSKVTYVRVFNYERSFEIIFDNGYALIFKMHSSRSNILLASNDKVVTVFRKNLANDIEITPSLLHKLEPTFIFFKEHEGNLKKTLPALGKEVNELLQNSGYSQLELNEKWDLLTGVLESINSNPISLIAGVEKKQTLSLLETDNKHLWQSYGAIEAANKLYLNITQLTYLENDKQNLLKSINKKIIQSRNYINKTQNKLVELRNARKYEEVANIMMANLHILENKTGYIELDDFYSNEKIAIKRKPNQTPQKQAEQLYRKGKNQKIEIANLETNLKAKREALNELELKREEIELTEDFKQLKTFSKSAKKEKPENLPYHQYHYSGFDILVGKNAKSNDELTTKIAVKNDFWLHAKDVPGSHVIIKNDNLKLPSNVLEYAAELAAWFSKRKNDTLCPVIYTEKKYVRKIKGAPAGAVRLERESTIMVKPQNH